MTDFANDGSILHEYGIDPASWKTNTAYFDSPSCSEGSCEDGCSLDDCIQVCDGSVHCRDGTLCTEAECEDDLCTHSCSSGSKHCGSVVGTVMDQPMSQEVSQDASIQDQQGPIQCPWILPGMPCDVVVGRNALGQHIYEEHINSQLLLPCPLDSCDEIVGKNNLPLHQANQHHPENYLCSSNDCEQFFPSSSDFLDHIMASHSDLDCRFAGCDFSFKDPTELKTHINDDHLQNDFFLWHGDGSLSNQLSSSVNNHSRLSNTATQMDFAFDPGSADSTFYTDSGSSEALNNFTRQQDLQGTNENSKYSCSSYFDQAQSIWKASKSSHKPIRANHAKTSTTTTSTTLVQSSANDPAISQDHCLNAVEHRCKWIEENNGLCNAEFASAKLLQDHIVDKHLSATSKSTVCHWESCSRNQNGLPDSHKLRRHILTHTDYRAFICEYCKKDFTTKGQLETHERIHTGEKPYECTECGKKCRNESVLKIHMRKHTGEKPHRCDKCDFRCADSTNLIKHKKTHEPPKFRCEICSRIFGRKGTLERHMKVHGR